MDTSQRHFITVQTWHFISFVTKYLLLVIVNTVSDMGNYMKYVIFFKDIVICKSKMVQKQCKILFGAPAFMDLQASVAASISVKNWAE